MLKRKEITVDESLFKPKKAERKQKQTEKKNVQDEAEMKAKETEKKKNQMDQKRNENESFLMCHVLSILPKLLSVLNNIVIN